MEASIHKVTQECRTFETKLVECAKERKPLEKKYENMVGKATNLAKELRDEKQMNICLRENQVRVLLWTYLCSARNVCTLLCMSTVHVAHIRTRTRRYAHARPRALHAHAYARTHMHAHKHTCTHACTHVRIHMYAHTLKCDALLTSQPPVNGGS